VPSKNADVATSSGSVTGLGRAITVGDESGSQRLRGLIRTSSELRPGDSGGPLFDSAHRVVGMNTAANVGSPFRGTRGADGYAIPINAAIVIAKQIVAGKGSPTVHVGPTAFLGLEIAGTNQGFSQGVQLAGTQSGTPAAEAGLGQGDVVTALDGKSVSTGTDITEILVGHHPGDKVSIAWTDAGGQSHTATLTLGTGPAA